MADPVFAERYRHAAAHDQRFDGHFVTGWSMSENFCRPGCSSRTPRPSRVVFYRTAAAAYAAGLLPCPRCRPGMTPSSAELTGGDSVAARALRLVADGEIDRRGVDGLAKKVGVSPRHVLREVEAVADCGPLDVARAGRVRLARLLLTTTTIPMRDVAVAAGFSSVRQFNSTIMAMHHVTPGAIRFGSRRAAHARAASAEHDAGPLVVRCALPTARPVGVEVFAAMAERLIPEVEEGADHWFARTVRLPHGPGHMRVDLDAAGRLLAKLACADLRDFAPLLYRAEQLFEVLPGWAPKVGSARNSGSAPNSGSALHADVAASAGSEVSSPVSGATDLSERLIRALVERHASPNSGRTVLGGLVSALGEITPWGLLFPTARAIADAGRTVLRGPTARVDAVMTAAKAIADGVIDIDGGWSTEALMTRHSAILAV